MLQRGRCESLCPAPAVPISEGLALSPGGGGSTNAIALISGQTGKLMYVMHNSEYPLSCFALFENGPCLIADANFDILMVKLKGFFQNAKANKIESRGTRYQYCDFLVKVGTVTMGPSARGISVEVRIVCGGYGIQVQMEKSHVRG